MKILLSWVFDHIEKNISEIDINALVARFNTHTAEVESFSQINFDKKSFDVVKFDGQIFTTASGLKIDLSARDKLETGSFYLIKHSGSLWVWATMRDFFNERDSLVPALWMPEEDFLTGKWQKHLPELDYILEVDNKSLTNRPDMWSHRGFAREIAYLCDSKLKNESVFLEDIKIEYHDPSEFYVEKTSFKNLVTHEAPAFSLTKILNVENKPSTLNIAARLMIIGSKPINSIIDATNYVMFDWGPPSHAYDSDLVNHIEVRRGLPGEKLELLDGSVLEVTNKDLVIADESNAIGLAGIKGGRASSISNSTKNIVLEAANFIPSSIRQTSQKFALRTDASSRFEKNLDPLVATYAAKRFVKLLRESNINVGSVSSISFGHTPRNKVIIKVGHEFLEKITSLKLTPQQIINVLESIDFKVEQHGNLYEVEVPTFRSTKNVLTKEDVAEEVARLVGFEKVESLVPRIKKASFDLAKSMRLRDAKKILAYGNNFIEQANYPFFDEDFCKQIKFEAIDYAQLLNPVSENQRKLVTTLIPNLLKNIEANKSFVKSIKFFEVAKTWKKNKTELSEQKMISGVIVERGSSSIFYQAKQIVDSLASLVNAKEFSWKNTEGEKALFCDFKEAADILYDNEVIGKCGSINKQTLINCGVEGKAAGFWFEINTSFLNTTSLPKTIYKPISKFQSSYIDLSILKPENVYFSEIVKKLSQISPLICDISLIDSFSKAEWKDKKSITIRLTLQHKSQNIEKCDIDLISSSSSKMLSELGLELR